MLGELKRAPKALWAFALLSLTHVLVLAVVGNRSVPLSLVGLVIGVLFSILLLRGSRIVWTLLAAGSAIELVSAPFSSPHWWTIVLSVVYLALLLVPPSWRYVWKQPQPAPTTGQTSRDPRTRTASNRPKGWYVDPDDPRYMHHWSGAADGWQGTTRTPRKVRKAWRQGQLQQAPSSP